MLLTGTRGDKTQALPATVTDLRHNIGRGRLMKVNHHWYKAFQKISNKHESSLTMGSTNAELSNETYAILSSINPQQQVGFSWAAELFESWAFWESIHEILLEILKSIMSQFSTFICTVGHFMAPWAVYRCRWAMDVKQPVVSTVLVLFRAGLLNTVNYQDGIGAIPRFSLQGLVFSVQISLLQENVLVLVLNNQLWGTSDPLQKCFLHTLSSNFINLIHSFIHSVQVKRILVFQFQIRAPLQ